MAQNSVKYNVYLGDVVILVTCKPSKEDSIQANNLNIEKINSIPLSKIYMLETKIIDSGIGISSER